MKKAKSEPIKTVLTITLGFLLLFIATKWKWTLTVSVMMGLAGLFSAFLAQKINLLWMKLAYILSLIVPNIVFGLIFYSEHLKGWAYIVGLFSIHSYKVNPTSDYNHGSSEEWWPGHAMIFVLSYFQFTKVNYFFPCYKTKSGKNGDQQTDGQNDYACPFHLAYSKIINTRINITNPPDT